MRVTLGSKCDYPGAQYYKYRGRVPATIIWPVIMAWIGLFVLAFVINLIYGQDIFDQILGNEVLRNKFYWASLAGNTPQLIQLRGFQPENHTVVTPDGYLIQIHRVVNQKRHLNGTRHGYPLIFFQGLWLASEGFFDNSDGYFSPETDSYTEFENNFTRRLKFACPALVEPVVAGRCLPCTLAACGYDVWLGNVRDAGLYSSHLLLSRDNPQYWNINLDSYTIDAKAIIDYVIKQSNSPTAGAICHSIGCNTMFQLLAEYAPYNNLVKPLFALGPYVFTQTTGSPLLTLPALIEPLTKNLLAPSPDFLALRPYLADLVRRNPIARLLYALVFTLVGGINPDEADWDREYRKPAHFPGIAAARVFAHAGQRRVTPELFKYNYGIKENLVRYGQAIPPIYNLARVTNRYIVLFRGVNDILADYLDLQRLKKTISAPLYHEIANNYSHTDFVLGRTVNVTTNLPILSILHQLKLNYN